MPKIIDNVKETVLKNARESIFSDGYGSFTLRGVAKKSGVAVGTIYNYYKSKDTLIASVMVEDWIVALTKMRAACAESASVEDGFYGIYSEIIAFSAIYSPVWRQYLAVGGSMGVVDSRHNQLRDSIVEIVVTLCSRFGTDIELPTARLLSDAVISAAMQEDVGFNALRNLVRGLYK